MYQVPFDKGELTFDLPAGWRGTVVESRIVPPIEDVPAAVAQRWPIRPTRHRCASWPGRATGSASSSPTSPAPAPTSAGAAAAAGAGGGRRARRGHHPAVRHRHAPAQHARRRRSPSWAEAVVGRYRVIDNEPQNPAALVDLGTTESGIPLSVTPGGLRGRPADRHRHRRAAPVRRLLGRAQDAGRRRGRRGDDRLHPRPAHGRPSRHAPGPHRGQSLPRGDHRGGPAGRPALHRQRGAGRRQADRAVARRRAGGDLPGAGRLRPLDVRGADPAAVRRGDRRGRLSQGRQPLPGQSRAPATSSSRRRRSSSRAASSSSRPAARKGPAKGWASSAS